MLYDLLICHAKPQAFLNGHRIAFNLRRSIDIVKLVIPQILSFSMLAQMCQFMCKIHVKIQWLPVTIVAFEESDEGRFRIFNIDITETFAFHDIYTGGIKQQSYGPGSCGNATNGRAFLKAGQETAIRVQPIFHCAEDKCVFGKFNDHMLIVPDSSPVCESDALEYIS